MEDRMRFCGGLRFGAVLRLMPAILVATGLVSLAPAMGQTRAPLFHAAQEACFGQVYDRAHLASHPSQKVTSLHIFRSLGERPEAENWQGTPRAERIKETPDTCKH